MVLYKWKYLGQGLLRLLFFKSLFPPSRFLSYRVIISIRPNGVQWPWSSGLHNIILVNTPCSPSVSVCCLSAHSLWTYAFFFPSGPFVPFLWNCTPTPLIGQGEEIAAWKQRPNISFPKVQQQLKSGKTLGQLGDLWSGPWSFLCCKKADLNKMDSLSDQWHNITMF